MCFDNKTGRPPAKDVEFIRINQKLNSGPFCFIRSSLESCDLGSPSGWFWSWLFEPIWGVRHTNMRALPAGAELFRRSGEIEWSSLPVVGWRLHIYLSISCPWPSLSPSKKDPGPRPTSSFCPTYQTVMGRRPLQGDQRANGRGGTILK